jgi:hypothetical protein
MAKRQKQFMIIALIVIILLIIFMVFRKNETYEPGDTKFFKSEIPSPEEATFIQPGDIENGKKYSTPNGEYYFLFRDDGELLWAKKNGEILWSLNTMGAGKDAKARFLTNGNICVMGGAISECSNSENSEVPKGQHLLILKNDGYLYIDHGLGDVSETRQFYPFD